MLLCTCSIKADPVSILCLWKPGKVSRLHGSSDIQSGLQRDQTSPSRIYRPAPRIKEIFLHWTGLCEMCSFGPWRHTRHLWSLLHLLCMCESLSAPSSFPSRHWLKAPSSQLVTLWRARQTQARHGKHLTSVSAWEHLALRLSACLTMSLHILPVCACLVVVPEFALLHRYRFNTQKLINTLPKQTSQMSHNNHSTIL